MIVANMWGPSTYYHNECDRCGAFLGLHLRLPTGRYAATGTIVQPGHPASNAPGRPAIGATVVVEAGGRTLARQVDGGNGHAGKRSPDLHFGLGAHTGAVKVNVKWRDNHGNVRQETHTLNPGWHTLMLASENRPMR